MKAAASMAGPTVPENDGFVDAVVQRSDGDGGTAARRFRLAELLVGRSLLLCRAPLHGGQVKGKVTTNCGAASALRDA